MAWDTNDIAFKLLDPKGDPSGSYLEFLNEITRLSNEPGVNYDNLMPTPGYGSQQARLLLAVEQLKKYPRQTRKEITFNVRNSLGSNYPELYINKLMEIAVQAIAMIDPSAGDWHAQDFVMGSYRPSSWQQDETLQSFCSRSVPFATDEAVAAAKSALDEKSSLRARKLQKRLGIRFYATNNLAEHLLLEHRHGKTRLYIFHHAGYLKTCLKQTKELKLPVDSGMDSCLE